MGSDLLALAVQGMAVLVAGSLIALAAWRMSASSRHLVLTLALGGALVVPAVAAVLPQLTMVPVPAALEPAVVEAVAAPTAAVAPAVEVERFDWAAALSIAWVAGVALVLVRLGASFVSVGRIARRARPIGRRHPAHRRSEATSIYQTPEVESPCVAGVFRPRILLPMPAREWSRARIDAALAHEAAHVRRCDPLLSALAHVACAVHWFNPVAWMARRWLGAAAEAACDDAALAVTARPSDYASYLLALAREQVGRAPLAAAAMLGPSDLERRIRHVLGRSVDRRALTWRVAIPVAIGGLGAVLTAATIGVGLDEPRGVRQSAVLEEVSQAIEHADPEARAHLAAAQALERTGDYERAEARYSEAVWVAAGANDEWAATTGAAALVRVTAVHRENLPDALLWARHTEAAAARLGPEALTDLELQRALTEARDIAIAAGSDAFDR